jgi:hypothetical protein
VLKPRKPPMNLHPPAQAPDAAPPAPPALAVPQPPERMAFFGRPPLLEGEDTDAYGDLLARVSAAIRPGDILEEIWLRDFLDLAWEAVRYRRLRAVMLSSSPSTASRAAEARHAHALVLQLDHVERIDRLIASAEARRNGVLREIERHRATLGAELRRVVGEAEDAEFEVIESPPAAAGVM